MAWTTIPPVSVTWTATPTEAGALVIALTLTDPTASVDLTNALLSGSAPGSIVAAFNFDEWTALSASAQVWVPV